MEMRMSRRGYCGILALVLTMLPVACSTVLSPGTPCDTLLRSVVGTWISTNDRLGSEWSFPPTFTLEGSQVYRAGSLVGLWDLGYTPGEDVCDVLFVGDSSGVIHKTYGLRMDGDYMVLSAWASADTYYYREGTSPPPSAD